MSTLDKYSVATPPSTETIEALANRIANYRNLILEDCHQLSEGPASGNTAVQTQVSQSTLFPIGGDPDAYLVKVDAEIERLSRQEVLTTNDRALRMQHALSCQYVLDEYKVCLAYINYPGVYQQMSARVHEIHQHWLENVFAPAHGTPLTPPTLETLEPTPQDAVNPASSGQPSLSTSTLTDSAIEDLLRDPSRLIGMQFQDISDEEESYQWELVSFTKENAGVEFFMECADLPGNRIPVGDEESLRNLLATSVLLSA